MSRKRGKPISYKHSSEEEDSPSDIESLQSSNEDDKHSAKKRKKNNPSIKKSNDTKPAKHTKVSKLKKDEAKTMAGPGGTLKSQSPAEFFAKYVTFNVTFVFLSLARILTN